MVATGRPKPGDMVVKGNALVHASYVMGRHEKMMMWWLIWAFQESGEHKLTIKCKDVAEFSGMAPSTLYREVWEVARRLRERELLLWNPEKDRVGACGFLSYVEYGHERSGEIDVVITKEIVPHIERFIEDLKIGFTKYEMGVIASLKTFHGLRLYEIAKSVNYGSHKVDGWECSFEELRKRFGCLVADHRGKLLNDEYQEWRRFKEKVLDKAVDEVNVATDLSVSYIARKAGKKVIGVRLMVKGNTAGRAVMRAEGSDRDSARRMAALGVSGVKINELIEAYGKSDPERLRYALKSAETAGRKGKVKNTAAWFVAAVKRDDRAQGSLFAERRAERDELRREAEQRRRPGPEKGLQGINAVLQDLAKENNEDNPLAEALRRLGENLDNKKKKVA